MFSAVSAVVSFQIGIKLYVNNDINHVDMFSFVAE